MNDYLEWVIDWFSKNTDTKKEDILNHLEDNFFSLEYIDSFGFIMLMGAVEDEFDISFDNDRFQDRTFSTIKGFATAIEEEKKA